MVRLALLTIVIVVGCRDDAKKADVPTGGSSIGSAGSAPAPVEDPWATPTNVPVAEQACPTVAAPYFFRIEKNGKTSYLLGTRHLGVAWRKMPDVVRTELREAKLVVFETVDDDGTDDSPSPHKGAANEAGPVLWKKYRELAGDAIADSVEQESPATAILMLSLHYEDRMSALEREIGHEAERLGTPIRALETGAFQQKLLDKYLNGRALRATIEQLDDLEELKKDTYDDLKEYCEGTDDTPGLDAKERAEMLASGYTKTEIDQMDKELLADRNHRWIPDLEKIFAEGDAFVAVGADHTRGPDGVPALLVAKGYTVTRVTPPK